MVWSFVHFSELSIEDLRGDLASAFASIPEVLAIEEGDTLSDAGEKSETVWESKTNGTGAKLTVLLVVVEGAQLAHDSVKVREVAVTIKIIELVKQLDLLRKGVTIMDSSLFFHNISLKG